MRAARKRVRCASIVNSSASIRVCNAGDVAAVCRTRLGVEKLSAPLALASEQIAKGLSSQGEMLEQIRREVGTRAPAAAIEMLDHFRKVSWHSLNAYIHSGIHVLRRQEDGDPGRLVLDVLRNSN